MGRIGIRLVGGGFGCCGVVVAGDLDDVTGCKRTSELAQRGVWREQAVIPNGVKSRRWNERCESAQKFDWRQHDMSLTSVENLWQSIGDIAVGELLDSSMRKCRTSAITQ